MEIIGYSERGAMNALFYGIALKDDKEAMRSFLELAGIKDCENYHEFKLYMEFSLSEFGSPDLVFTALDKDENKTVFFVEAKVSACGKYDLKTQLEKHEKEYDASNLFFQLRSKEYFFQHKCKDCDSKNYDDLIKCKKGKHGEENCRELGSNIVVNRFANVIKQCKSAEYIAIIPKQKSNETVDTSKFGFKIHYVTWEEIYYNDILKEYVGETIRFNQNEKKSQILNSPV